MKLTKFFALHINDLIYRRQKSNHIKILKFGFYAPSATCPICGRKSVSVKIVCNSTFLRLCKCGSILNLDLNPPDYSTAETEDSFYMRVDQAEGIDSIIRPMFPSPELSSLSVVDIGCGMGFGADFLKFSGRNVQAFDPSGAAVMSNKLLKFGIETKIAQGSEITTPEPRIAFASEVIEHVPDPLEFLIQLKEISTENGYVVLTTPNADLIRPETDQSLMIAMLALSQHIFLLSPKALSSIASKAGFKWHTTWVENERLFLVAGNKPVTIKNVFSRQDFIKYLEFKLENSVEIEFNIRLRSFGYRLFKEYVNAALWEDANRILAQLTAGYSILNFDLGEPEQIVKKYILGSSSGSSMPKPKLFPFNMPVLLFLIGNFHSNATKNYSLASRFYKSSIELSNLYGIIFGKNPAQDNLLQGYDLEVQEVARWSLDSLIAISNSG